MNHHGKKTETEALHKLANETHALDWVISYEDADGEPFAFRLARDGGQLVAPPQVIGETFEDASACINLAGVIKKSTKKGRSKKGGGK